jgi:predicted alpha-1,6-mannanase (GH76 family)
MPGLLQNRAVLFKITSALPRVWLALTIAFFSGLYGQAQSSPEDHQSEQANRVRIAAQELTSSYDPATGLFRGTGWWNSANGITALANASRELKTNEFDSIFTNTFDVAQHHSGGFLNEFYDDEGWWALAWLDVYSLRGGNAYLQMSKSIFADMTGGWSDSCGGGIWWKKNEHYKNAIANELFLSVAVRLALLSHGKARADYLLWAKKEERWFLSSGMINADSLVNDGLDASCHNNGKTAWTYNQGVLLTGLAGFSKLTHERAALQRAELTSKAVTQHLTDANGVIHDPCEPDCGADGVQFKGILMRNLLPLLAVSPSPELTTLVQQNAESVWTRARTPANQFSVDWAGPPADGGTGSLISALDSLVSALSLNPQSTSRHLR